MTAIHIRLVAFKELLEMAYSTVIFWCVCVCEFAVINKRGSLSVAIWCFCSSV